MKPITYKDLISEEQKIMQDVYPVVIKLMEFNNKLNSNLLSYLFEAQVAKHLWDCYLMSKRDFFTWFNKLSLDNKSIILCNIFYNKGLYSNC